MSGYQDLDAGNVLSWNVSGLSGSPTNYYRVRAYNANGTSGNSATIIVPPPTGDPTTKFVWNCTSDTDQNWGSGINWVGGVAPEPGSSNIIVFRGDILVPWNWPNIDTNYGTTILIFSNDVLKNGIKITAGIGHTMNLGSYVLNDQPANAESPCYFGIDSDIDIPWSQRGVDAQDFNSLEGVCALAIGSSTRMKRVMPMVKRILSELPQLHGLPVAAFGSYGWSGEAPDEIGGRLKELGGTLVSEHPIKA